ncbi:MAG TPA: hypothetical protein VJN96_03485 [Vicinamibacterales bacterium]|nr:hypothetical protein [Vicinamibacterales bacterium]
MDLQTTNLWLAVIAITGLVQMALTLAVAYYVTSLVRRAQQAIDAAVADTRPLMRQVSAALDDVSDLVQRTRRAEASVNALVDRVGTTVDHVKTVALTKVWPAVGIARGLRAAAAAIRERRRRRFGEREMDEMAESRFLDEGGANARPVRRHQ